MIHTIIHFTIDGIRIYSPRLDAMNIWRYIDYILAPLADLSAHQSVY